jgi:hypothetical protein
MGVFALKGCALENSNSKFMLITSCPFAEVSILKIEAVLSLLKILKLDSGVISLVDLSA